MARAMVRHGVRHGAPWTAMTTATVRHGRAMGPPWGAMDRHGGHRPAGRSVTDRDPSDTPAQVLLTAA